MPALYHMNLLPAGKKQPALEGRAVHGLFFRLLAEINPQIAEQIHHRSEKPFSISALSESVIQISVFCSELELELEKMTVHQFTGITIDAMPVAVKIRRVKVIDPLRIWENIRISGPLGNLRVQYLSPTSFRRDGVQELFPDPGLLFRSLHKKAGSFCGEWFGQETTPPEEFVSQIRVARYELKTQQAGFGRYMIIGCTGQAIYDCRRIDVPVSRKTVAFLATVAPFIGVGYKTTMGMGRVECSLEGV